MASLGEQLRTGREATSLTIEETAALTHIPREHLVALEADDFDALPGPPFTQGFIRIYADALNLDIAPLLDAYRDQSATSEPTVIATPVGRSSRKLWLTTLIVALAASMVMVIGIPILSNSDGDAFNEGVQPADGSSSASAVPHGALFELIVTSPTQVRIEVDGRTFVDKTLDAEEVRQWTPERETEIELAASDAATLTISGEAVPQFAVAGQPMRHKWRVEIPTAAPVAPLVKED